MAWNQLDGNHEYLVTPTEYPINDNEAHSTYDQFIQLRDTLIYSNKYYNDKADRKLCVGSKFDGSTTNTIEVLLPNKFKQSFEPNRKESPEEGVTTGILGKYVSNPSKDIPEQILTDALPLCCQIQRDGHYQLIHKEQILLEPETNKVCCYIDIYRKNEKGIREIPYKGGVAVFDWEGGREDDNTHYKKTFPIINGSISGTCHGEGGGSVDGSCKGNVEIKFTLGDIIQKMTAFGYMERDLKKGDFLVLRMKDKGANEETGEPQGNDLKLQQWSNYWSIKRLDPSENI